MKSKQRKKAVIHRNPVLPMRHLQHDFSIIRAQAKSLLSLTSRLSISLTFSLLLVSHSFSFLSLSLSFFLSKCYFLSLVSLSHLSSSLYFFVCTILLSLSLSIPLCPILLLVMFSLSFSPLLPLSISLCFNVFIAFCGVVEKELNMPGQSNWSALDL